MTEVRKPLEASRVRADAHGKWPSILGALGIDKQFLLNRHGPCPICNGGKDRYRFDDKGAGRWICSQCGAGDGFALLQQVKGWNFRETLQEVAKVTGTARPVEIRLGPTPEEVREQARDIWKNSHPLESVEATRLWWLARIGQVPEVNDLRAREALTCPGHGLVPAMVAFVRGPDGAFVNLHRTFLRVDGAKADVPEPRRVLALELPAGSAVRLVEPSGGVLAVAEGIETAAAVTTLYGVPCWSTLNATLLEKWIAPEGVSQVLVFGDNDPNFHGQKAAYALANRLSSGKAPIAAEVRITDKAGTDWNDVLHQQLARSEAA